MFNTCRGEMERRRCAFYQCYSKHCQHLMIQISQWCRSLRFGLKWQLHEQHFPLRVTDTFGHSWSAALTRLWARKVAHRVHGLLSVSQKLPLLNRGGVWIQSRPCDKRGPCHQTERGELERDDVMTEATGESIYRRRKRKWARIEEQRSQGRRFPSLTVTVITTIYVSFTSQSWTSPLASI